MAIAIHNVLASVAVKDLKAATTWYERLLGRPADSNPMPEIAEWEFERGGCLQEYQLPERAGHGSFTLAVSGMEDIGEHVQAMGIATNDRPSGERVKTLMITDPDGNHIAVAETFDPSMAR